MDPIFDRLGRLFRSAFETDEDTSTSSRSGDPDLNDAMDELDDFLNSGKAAEEENRRRKEQARAQAAQTRKNPLAAEYAVLGLTTVVPMEEVTKAYKKLIIANHPDRHSADPAALKKATEMTQRINQAYQKIKAYNEKK